MLVPAAAGCWLPAAGFKPLALVDTVPGRLPGEQMRYTLIRLQTTTKIGPMTSAKGQNARYAICSPLQSGTASVVVPDWNRDRVFAFS